MNHLSCFFFCFSRIGYVYSRDFRMGSSNDCMCSASNRCAFLNTPKYNQVKGKGKIVKKEWIEDAYNMRCCLPWKRWDDYVTCTLTLLCTKKTQYESLVVGEGWWWVYEYDSAGMLLLVQMRISVMRVNLKSMQLNPMRKKWILLHTGPLSVSKLLIVVINHHYSWTLWFYGRWEKQ